MTKISDWTSENLWVISSGRRGEFAVNRSGVEQVITAAREYRISALGRYLIAPEPITVQRRLIGCEVQWKSSAKQHVIPKIIRTLLGMGAGPRPCLKLISDDESASDKISDINLNQHIKSMEDKLRLYSDMHRTLAQMDISQVANIIGICQDDMGIRSQLTISGDPPVQMEFVKMHVETNLSVQLKQSQIGDGLFDLQGFDLTQWDPGSADSLVCMSQEDKPAACVLNKDYSVAFWLGDPNLVGYLQLFEYCLKTNKHMRESLRQCIAGNAAPMRLMFNQDLEINYAKAKLPAIFSDIIKKSDQQTNMAQVIKKFLNHDQLGVSLNSLFYRGESQGSLCTDISILQEVKALEPVREKFPEVFQAISRQASDGEAGRFYLLDSVRGVGHAI